MAYRAQATRPTVNCQHSMHGRRCKCSTKSILPESSSHRELVLAGRSPQILHVPWSKEQDLCRGFIQVITSLNYHEAWAAWLPAQIGHNKALDYASRAVVKARLTILRPKDGAVDDGLSDHTRAIAGLRELMSHPRGIESDTVLGIAATLSFYESVMQGHVPHNKTHVLGVSAIIRGRSASRRCSALATALLYGDPSLTFHRSCAHGEPSPFEGERWLSLKPVNRFTQPREVTSLQYHVHQLRIRLPRLVACVRILRGDLNNQVKDSTLALAQSLLALKDSEGETYLLHAVRITRTEHPFWHAFIPFSTDLPGFSQRETALFYWEVRILTSRLCLRLLALYPDIDFNAAAIQAENERMAMNVLMAWQSTNRDGYLHTLQAYMALMAAWAVITDAGNFKKTTSEQWRDSMMHNILGGGAIATAEDLDEIADLLAGGPLQGYYVEKSR